MSELDDQYLFMDDDNVLPSSMESPNTVGKNMSRRLGLASQMADAIRSNNNSSVFNKIKTYFAAT